MISSAIRIDHATPSGERGEPLLWVPDIVAGVVTGGREEYRAVLDAVLTEHRIWLD